jgi:hypothetical protein
MIYKVQVIEKLQPRKRTHWTQSFAVRAPSPEDAKAIVLARGRLLIRQSEIEAVVVLAEAEEVLELTSANINPSAVAHRRD